LPEKLEKTITTNNKILKLITTKVYSYFYLITGIFVTKIFLTHSLYGRAEKPTKEKPVFQNIRI